MYLASSVLVVDMLYATYLKYSDAAETYLIDTVSLFWVAFAEATSNCASFRG